MNRLLISLLLSFIFIGTNAQEEHRIIPVNLGDIVQVIMPELDNETLLQAELALRNPERAPRFAETHEVNITPFNAGTWESLSSGDMIWRIYIESKGAKSLNFGFTEYRLPKEASLIIYDPESFKQAGPFTINDNEEHDQLWSPMLESDALVVQLIVPQKSMENISLRLSYINHDFLGLRNVLSGSCNVDVVCSEEDGAQFALIDEYRDIIQSVGLATFSGNAFCTGFLINNVRQDETPYYMTAHHCGLSNGNAGALVVYWNFENSVCRPPGSGASGGAGDGNFTQFNSGSFFRATYQQTDFTLVELDDPVLEEADAFFAGWNRTDVLPEDSLIAIHHPSLDEKRISFEYDAPYRGFWANGGANIPNGDHIIIPDWDMGTTEGGSSGSPLFDKNKRIIGQLHGGQAACNNNQYDSYGWLHFSWEGGGTPNSRLKDWLDPDDTGIEELGGLGEMIVLPVTPNNQKACKPDELDFTVEIPNIFTLPVNLSATSLPNGVSIDFSQNPVDPGNPVTATLSGITGATPNSYTATIKASDGVDSTTADLVYIVIGDMVLNPNLENPGNLIEDENVNPTFRWTILGGDDLVHQLQVALDVDFNNLVIDEEGIEKNSFQSPILQNETTYYWRVRSSNLCGPGPWSTSFAFKTGTTSCVDNLSLDTPIIISSAGTPTVNSTQELVGEGVISKFSSITLKINHSYIGDLEARLISPSGGEILLFDRPGFPAANYGCDGENMEITLSDLAENTAQDLESTCGAQIPTITGEFQPMEALSTFIGEEIQGNWVLRIKDNENQDGGQILEWQMNFCTGVSDALAVNIDPNDLMVCDGEISNFEVTLGDGFEPSGVTLSADNLPDGLFVTFDENPVQPGSTTIASVSSVDLPDGNYQFNVIAEDGVNTTTIEVRVELITSPLEVVLSEPSNGEMGLDINPTFIWEMKDEIENYFLEIARDETFSDLVFSIGLISSPYELTDIDLDYENVYFWRVSALNVCGQMPSPSRSFTTTNSSSIQDVDLEDILIYPNPSRGMLVIDFGGHSIDFLEAEVISLTGQRISSKKLFNTGNKFVIDLYNITNGTYVLKLKSKVFSLNRKFVILR